MGGCWSLYAWMSFCASSCDSGGVDLQPLTARPAPNSKRATQTWNFITLFTRPPQTQLTSESQLICSAILAPLPVMSMRMKVMVDTDVGLRAERHLCPP